jgi:hypothetical protein
VLDLGQSVAAGQVCRRRRCSHLQKSLNFYLIHIAAALTGTAAILRQT